MKKIIFLALALLSVSFTTMAEKTITREYYGSKARDSKKNPCKGDVDSLCGTVKITTDAESATRINVTELYFNEKNQIVNQVAYQTEETMDQLIVRFQNETPENAILFINHTNGHDE